MGEHTNIPYVHHTFSPWHGCSHAASPGCDFCYAREQDRRFGGEGGHWDGAPRRFLSERHWHNPIRWNRRAESDGVRRRVLCGSMCDVLEPRLEVGASCQRLWQLIAQCPGLDWLLLSKRPENAAEMVPRPWMEGQWPENVWMGATIEHQPVAASRARALGALPAPVRFVSAEPLLGELTLTEWLSGPGAIHWVISGGESGVRARRTDPAWVLWLRDQCAAASVPLFFKQWGRWLPVSHAKQMTLSGMLYFGPRNWKHAGRVTEYGEAYYAVGKKKASFFLGGYRYHQLPGDEKLEKTL